MKDESDDPKSKRGSPPSEPTGQPSGAPRLSILDRLRQLIELTDKGLESERRREMLSVIKAEQLVQDQVLQLYQQEVAMETLVTLADMRAEAVNLLMAFSRRPDLTIREGRLMQHLVWQFFRSEMKCPGQKRPSNQRPSGSPWD